MSPPLTIETAVHASGITALVVFLLEAREIRDRLPEGGGGFLGFSPVLSIIFAEIACSLWMYSHPCDYPRRHRFVINFHYFHKASLRGGDARFVPATAAWRTRRTGGALIPDS